MKKTILILIISIIPFVAIAQMSFNLKGTVTKKISSEIIEGTKVELLRIKEANYNGTVGQRAFMLINENNQIINYKDLEKIQFSPEGEPKVEFYVLEQTTVGGIDYYLVTDTEDESGTALILKDLSKKEEQDAVFEIVSDDAELDAVASIVENLLHDICLTKEDTEAENN